ncbi:MAG: hypothetical protein LBQ39_07030 [Tannerellaceae bacterium]|jgi:ferredoxin-thioredoxin reductase catalytic subunit|nr:hypothetical protein [Tannerellaceae bacterium]
MSKYYVLFRHGTACKNTAEREADEYARTLNSFLLPDDRSKENLINELNRKIGEINSLNCRCRDVTIETWNDPDSYLNPATHISIAGGVCYVRIYRVMKEVIITQQQNGGAMSKYFVLVNYGNACKNTAEREADGYAKMLAGYLLPDERTKNEFINELEREIGEINSRNRRCRDVSIETWNDRESGAVLNPATHVLIGGGTCSLRILKVRKECEA